jgi:glutamate 5-kinase
LKQSERSYNRIVVKIGSSLFFRKLESSGIDLDFGILQGIIRQIIGLVNEGKEVVLVSSGAIALGMSLLKTTSRPKELSRLQAMAAVGQHELMDVYRQLFKKSKLNCAQVLLTYDDFNDRGRYLNARNTLFTLLKLNIVAVVNENDTVSTEEIKFGDNDRLSALVASLISADLLIILSDVDGLLDNNKKVVKVVSRINQQIRSLACPTSKATCVGGMITKLDAAKIAVDSGIACVIANGHKLGVISEIAADPGSNGTLFIPEKRLDERQRWLAFGTKSKGKVAIDEGAKRALLNKKSLLSVGITQAEGAFECGDIVSIVDKEGNEFGRGKICLSCRQLDKVKGTRTDKEVIHCDNMVIL